MPPGSPLTRAPGLSERQASLLEAWLPGATVVRDLGWGEVDRLVLAVEHRGERLTVKAGGPQDHHQGREIHAHLHWLRPWQERGSVPLLRHHEAGASLLVTTFLPGRLVLGSPDQHDPGVFRQAGRLLALLHRQRDLQTVDPAYEPRENARLLAHLDGPHRIAPATVRRLRAEVASWPAPPAVLVPTHGDWQPRNWVVDRRRVGVIDLGRAALRPALTDLVRLAAQDFAGDPALEDAFVDGYGEDPRERDAWHRARLREAVATAAWAFRTGLEDFEAQGHRMVAAALAEG